MYIQLNTVDPILFCLCEINRSQEYPVSAKIVVSVTSNQMFHFSAVGTPSSSGHSCERSICRECASHSNSAEAGTALPSVGSDDFRLQLCMNSVLSVPDPHGSEYGIGGGGCCNVVNKV